MLIRTILNNYLLSFFNMKKMKLLSIFLNKQTFVNVQKKLIRQNIRGTFIKEGNFHENNNLKDELKFDNIIDKQVNKPNNLYLQVLSCLSKIEKNENEKIEIVNKIKEILKDDNIEINDKKIMKIIALQNLKSKDNNQLSDEIKKIIDAELSEEEFVEKHNFRFVRPPHSPEELKKVLVESEKIYEENKPFFFTNDRKVNENYAETFMKKIPRFFTMRKLVYPETKTEILLCGVRRNSNIHSVFLSKVIEKLSPDAIMLHMPPDIPLFIETETNYINSWKSFIQKGENSLFNINPLPTNLNETIVSYKKIDSLIEKTFKKANDINISSKIVYSVQKTLLGNEYFGDAFLTTFIHSYHSKIDKFCPVYVCDYPILRQIENISNTVKLSELKEYFNIYIQELGKQHYDFHPEFLGYKHFLDNRLKYSVETVRQACFTHKKLVFVTNYRYVDKIMENWKKLGKNIKNLKDFYPSLTRGNDEHLIMKKSFEDELYSDKFLIRPDDMSFVDFIEKLVIIDFFFENFINDNFIKFQNFPFSGKHTTAWMSGFCNLFSLWDHYTKLYKEKIDQFSVYNKDYKNYFNQFNYIDNNDKESEDEEDLDKNTQKYQKQMENPAKDEILKELNSKKPLEVDNIIDTRKNPFKSLKKK